VALDRFQQVLGKLVEAGIRPPLAHAANSAAVLTLQRATWTYGPAGHCAVTGCIPRPRCAARRFFGRRCASKPGSTGQDVAARSYVGYGNTYQTSGEQRIAVIPVG